jgi:adenosylhomocysteine nucleosidase
VTSPGSGVVVLAALEEELALLRRGLDGLGLRFARMGVGPVRAAEAALAACKGARLVVVAGCCGGLVPGAETGMVVVPARLIRFERGQAREAPAPDAAWRAAAVRAVEEAGLHGSERPLVSVAEALYTRESKRACQEATGAVAVDMETAAVAEEAGVHGVPLLAMRVVLDTASEELPNLGLSGKDGRRSPLRIAAAALTHPRALLNLGRLALRFRTVGENLTRCLRPLFEEG